MTMHRNKRRQELQWQQSRRNISYNFYSVHSKKYSFIYKEVNKTVLSHKLLKSPNLCQKTKNEKNKQNLKIIHHDSSCEIKLFANSHKDESEKPARAKKYVKETSSTDTSSLNDIFCLLG
jgi:hypothetical protein